jgi:hypothetical protein
MTKYIVSDSNNSIEIEIDNLVEETLLEKIADKFQLFGSFSKKLSYISLMDIYTFTLHKRGIATTLIIKKVLEQSTIDNSSLILTKLDELIKGNISHFELKRVGRDDIENLLTSNNYKLIDTDRDENEIIDYYCHDNWETLSEGEGNGEYVNRLNVSFDLSNFTVCFELEENVDVFAELNQDKKDIERFINEIEEIEEKISILENDKLNISNRISDIEHKSRNTFY